MTLTPDAVKSVLSQQIDPHRGKDYVTTKAVKNIRVDGDAVAVRIVLDYPAKSQHAAIARAIETALRAVLPVKSVFVEVSSQIAIHKVPPPHKPHPGVKNIIAVASGKGGVGKSTTAVNLALALATEGAQVGVLDADIYGPSIPQMLGLGHQNPVSEDGQKMEPLVAYGLQAMSIGFMIDPDTPMIWRGPMASNALVQLFTETRWHDVDYLVIDLPPGTGDIQLTLSQKIPVTGAVIVTTPQDIALLDARKGLQMFRKVNVPVLGVVENMSLHICSRCGHEEPIFGHGGGEKMCAEYGVPFLGALPLDIHIREQTDGGAPTVVADPQGPIAAKYREIARQVAVRLADLGPDMTHKFPNVVVQSK